jgi:succinate dehydrogenase/fumarate reductase-like Fe-S protein
MEFDDKDIKITELTIRIKDMGRDIANLQSERDNLLKVIKDNGLEEEVLDKRIVTDEEYICLNEIRKLKASSEIRDLIPDEVKILDTLFKILRTIKTGKEPEQPKKSKPADVKELFKLVSEGSGE